jgi:hypothetical protein
MNSMHGWAPSRGSCLMAVGTFVDITGKDSPKSRYRLHLSASRSFDGCLIGCPHDH